GVRTVAISPDGKTLASGGWDKTVRLWDLDSAKLRATLNGHEGYVARVAFDPSGTLLASAAWDGTVIIWDVATQRQLVRMDANDSKINALLFDSPDRLLAGSSRLFSFTQQDLGSPSAVLATLSRERGVAYANAQISLGEFGAGLVQ
ncbi:MAG: WD40 repeat domain-containing protein, partial [Myxococcaceae bacterium]